MVRQGDIVWLDFEPQIGHEQKGRRPALVLSNNTLNMFSDLPLVCPITNTDKGYPFHVKLDSRTKTTGCVLCDQARMSDINARRYEHIERIPDDILLEVLDILKGFIEIE
ncbi:MAG: type II toxin-antitoxin system PemK/MazF family toxin [Treponema sp.]|jgi:mRNA interferase MazF|nr:type II toxin-antitoxin system PemK/MazF family toxin [Treponema sp.]